MQSPTRRHGRGDSSIDGEVHGDVAMTTGMNVKIHIKMQRHLLVHCLGTGLVKKPKPMHLLIMASDHSAAQGLELHAHVKPYDIMTKEPLLHNLRAVFDFGVLVSGSLFENPLRNNSHQQMKLLHKDLINPCRIPSGIITPKHQRPGAANEDHRDALHLPGFTQAE